MRFNGDLQILAWFFLYSILPFFVWEGFFFFEQGIFAFFLYVLTCLNLAIYSHKSKDSLVQTTFWVFVYVFFVVAAIAQGIEGVYPWIDQYQDSDVNHAFFIIFLGCLFFSFGCFQSKFKGEFHLSFNKSRMIYFSFAAPLLTVAALSKYGGFEVLFFTRENLSSVLEGDVALANILQSFIRVPVFVSSIYFLHTYLTLKNKKHPDCYVYRNLSIIFCVATLIINNPISTPRFWVACVALSYLFLILKSFDLKLNRIYSILLIFLISYVFPISDAFRRTTDTSITEYIASQNLKDGLVYSPNYDAFQQVVNSVVFVEQHSHTFGHQFVSALLFWVPRSIWSSKAQSSGEMLAFNAKYDYSNLSCPLWAEIYLDFGVIGIPFFFFFLGALFKRIDSSKYPASSVFAIFLASYNFYFLRGSLMSVLGLLFIFTLVFFLVCNKKDV